MTAIDFKKSTIEWTEDDGSGGVCQVLRYQPTEAGAKPFVMGHFDVPNSGSSRHNHNFTMGWNLGPNGGRIAVGSETAMGLAFEQFYQPSGSSESFMEHHLLFVTTDDVQKRPISWMMNRGTGEVDGTIEAKQFSIARVGGSQATFTFFCNPNGAGQLLIGAWDNPCDIKFGYNNAPILYQRKANGSQYVNVVYVNANDEVVIGPTAPVKTGQSLAVGSLAAGGIVKAEPSTGKLAVVEPATVTGSRADNAALANLLTKLADLGIIVDGTTESANG